MQLREIIPWINLLRGYWRTMLLVLVISIGTVSLFPFGFHDFIIHLLEPQAPQSEHQALACATDPDFSILANSIAVNPPTCPDTDFSVSFDIENVGDLAYSGNLEVSFYQGDPNNAGAIFLNTETASLSGFGPGNVTTLNMTVTGTGPSFQLYIAVNDAGVTTTPITWPTSAQTECDYSDNVASVAVEPNPFTVSLEKIQDNTKCDVSLPDNGAARAFVLEGSNEVIAGYTFQWFRFGDPVFTGPIISGIDEGDYQVVATHDASQCHSDTASITIIRDNASSPILEIVQNRLFDDCRKPNGKATVKVVDPNDPSSPGLPPGKYEYLWFEGNQIFVTPPIGTSEVENSLWPIFYSVYVKDKKTGCDNVATILIMDDPNAYPVPDISVTDVTSCVADNGALSARVDGKTSPFTFEWYIGPNVKPSPDFTDPDLTGLPPGDYTLVVTNKCPSDPVTVTIADNRITPVVNVNLDAEQTSCNVSAPNGAVSASVDETAQGGSANETAGYTFEWFSGQTTSGSTVATGASVTGLASGTYTVLVTDDITGCFNSAEIFIPENLEIPVPTATVTDQNACDPPDGSVSANVAGETAGFSFYWFIGNIGTPSLGNADFTTAAVNNLVAGDYTLVVVNNTTQCESSPQVYTINDNTTTPVINLLSLTEQGSCDPANPSGSISVDADGTTSGYTFRWFNGQNTLPANEITPSPGASINGLAAGTYTVLVRNTTTGCEATAEYTINETLTIPVPAVTVTDQDACDPPNGSLSADVGGQTAGFSFYWFIGNVGTPTLANADYTTAAVTDLVAGDYTLVVVDDNNQCQSAPEVHTINDNTSTPVINLLSLTDQGSCDPANPTGSISVDADGTTSGYTFRWFNGQNTLPANEITPSPGASINGLAAGTYTVLVRNTTTGCEATAEYTINEVLTIPVPAVTVTDQDACDPPNGSLSADVGGQTAGFSFYWFIGNVGTPTLANADYTTAAVTDLVAGDYTLVVVDDVNQCQSAPEVHTINDNTSTPVINLLSLTDQGSCDPANPTGSISVDADGTTSGYTFRWFNGQNTLPANEITPSPGASINGLAAGTYTVLVRNTTTGCEATAEYTINEVLTIPVPAVTVTDQDACDPPNGSLSADVGGQTAGFSFYWFIGNVGTPTLANADYTTAAVTDLVAGDYTLVVVDDVNQCQSAPEVHTINDNTTTPVINLLSVTDQESCDPASPTGGISVDADGTTTGYTFRWFNGQNTLPVNEITPSPGATITGLDNGIYTVLVRNDLSGCENSLEVTVNENIIVPTLSANTIDLTNCSPLNGSITVNVSSGVPADYTFSWYDGTVTKATPDYAETGNTLTTLDAGDYTVEAFNNITNCSAEPITVTIADNTPVITITQTDIVKPSDCNTAAGELEVLASSPGAPVFTYEWFSGRAPFSGGPIGTGTRITGLLSGVYTVIVTDQSTGCQADSAMNLPFDGAPEVLIDVTNTVNNNTCDASAYNGEIAVQIDPATLSLTDPGDDQNEYLLHLYAGPNPIGTPTTQNSPAVFTDLAPGDYTIVAEQNFSPNCPSVPILVTIEDEAVNPVLDVTQNTPNTNCGPTNSNGILEIEIDGGAAPTDYNINWFEGSDTGAPPLGTNFGVVTGINGERIEQLPGGFYTAEVTNIASGCTTVDTYQVFDNQEIITITAVDMTLAPQDDCSPPNGSATVNAIREDGVAVAYNGTNYDFEWYDENLNLLPTPTPANSYTGLAAGIYFVVAINNSSSCRGSEVAFEIEDQSTAPTVTLNVVQPNVNCDVSNPTGSLQASVNGTLADYTIEWFEGENSTTTPLPGANVSGTNGELAINLAAGFYTVRFTDNVTPGIGCSTTATMEIVDDFPEVTISQADLTLTPQDDCSPTNGSATVNAVTEDGVATAYNGTNYEFEWYDENLNLLPDPSPENNYTGLAAGSYFVVAINTSSSCRSSEVAFEIEDQTAPPIVTLNVLQPNVNCDVSNPTGSLEASVNGTLADYTIEWFEGENSTTTPLPGANVSGANGELAINLAAGFYTVRITDNVTPGIGCSTTATMEIVDDLPDITISQADLVVTPQDDCSPPNGSATVNAVTEDGVATAYNGSNYEFEWYDENLNLLPDPSPENNYTGLAAGSYFVVAINTTSGCRSSEVAFEIEDQTALPMVTLAVTQPNISCDVSNPMGALEASVNGNLTDYTIEWFEGENSTTTPLPGANVSGANGELAINLAAGFYTVRFTDNVTPGVGCSTTATMEIVDDFPEITISQADLVVTPQDDCSPANGSATVNSITEDGVTNAYNGTNYDFEWFDENLNLLPAPNPANSYSGLAAGSYFVVAINATTACRSSEVAFEIEDQSALPVVTLVVTQPNISCDASNPMGALEASVNGNLADYIIEWFEGENNTTTPLPGANVSGTNGELAINLAAGFYTVRFTDNVNPGVGCQAIATMEIIDDPAQLTITQADLFLHPQENCSPPNGEARVDTVREDGVAVAVNGTNYSFEWYDDAMNLLPGSANQINNIVAGQYFVVAINNTTGCRTDEVAFEILDETSPPVIELPSFMNPTQCDGVNQGGTLVVTSDGVSDTNNYTYEWYVGGQPVSGSPFIANNFVADNLSAIEYTVVVTNNATGCSSAASYTLQTEVVTPFVSASSEPVTNCDAPNGSLFATVINTTATYDFNWYTGTDTSGSPDFTGQTVENMGPGTYTVIAIDQSDASCISEPDTVIIEDARFDGFLVEITPEAPLSNCDPANPNGILSATVNGEITGYEYEWYLGTDTTAVPVAFGSVATGLTDTLYTVVAIDVITQCRNTASYTLGSEFLPIPIPDTNVMDATSCIVGNGAIQATVGGNVKDYTFDWYPGNEVVGTPIFTGPDLVDLNSGEEYTVTATSNITGCTSDPITAIVGEDKNAPQFEYQVSNATCLDQNGVATIILEDTTNVALIEWSNGVQGPELRNYPPGQYMVTVTDTLGCATTQMIEIGSEINVFNGVSPNGDGFNDIFHIDCIQNFPNNIVRIYNRAGQLVYMHEGYDNTTVFFDGVGNEGIYLSGNQVPDGTYYYIVDKRDGSEPRAGYLELLR